MPLTTGKLLSNMQRAAPKGSTPVSAEGGPAPARARGEGALEHAGRGPEGLDAGLDVGAPRLGQLRRGRRRVVQVEVESAHLHGEAAPLRPRLRRGAAGAD